MLGSRYTCIDANDNIFDCCLLRKSAPTTPCTTISINALIMICSTLTIYSSAKWLAILPDQGTCIIIEFNYRSILSLYLLRCPDYNCMPDVSSSYFVTCCGRCVARSSVADRAGLLYDDDNTITLCVSVAGIYIVAVDHPHRLCRASSFVSLPHIRQ